MRGKPHRMTLSHAYATVRDARVRHLMFTAFVLLWLVDCITPSWKIGIVSQDTERRSLSPQALQENALFDQLLHDNKLGRCAIHLYGLPRAFRSLVLPSLLKNVLQPNQQFSCDFFVHYFNLTAEKPGRSGSGGSLDPHEIRLLSKAVAAAQHSAPNAGRRSTVKFVMDQESAFWDQRADLLHKIHTTLDHEGRPLYHPWKDPSYSPATLDNVLKMWHSIQASWQLMEKHATATNVTYTRVAMLRSDVLYMTPINIWERGNVLAGTHYDLDNGHAVIPGFAKFPVSDRMIYGPLEAVRIWAADRFDVLKRQAQQCALPTSPCHGMLMHSEFFVQRLLESVDVEEHATLCFFRTRADESVWFQDCDNAPQFASPHIQMPKSLRRRRKRVEQVLGRPCRHSRIFKVPTGAKALKCEER